MKRILFSTLAVALFASPAMAQGKKQLALVTNAADFWTIAKRGVEKAKKEHPDIPVSARTW
jgi:ribose transport system substrate-binding protein